MQAASEGVSWRLAWWLLALSASLCLLLIPIVSLLEGSHQVEMSQRNQLISNIVSSTSGWIILWCGGGLYAVSAMLAVRAILGHSLNTVAARPILRLRKELSDHHQINWRKDFWPQQWRIFLSWLAGFLVFQSFVLIAFKLSGPVAAGQMGLTVQAFHAINQLASARLMLDQPRMGTYAAKGDIAAIRNLVRIGIQRNTLAAIVLTLAAVALVLTLKHLMPSLGDRFGNISMFALFVSMAIAYQISNVETAAIRFQKKEPFVMAGLVSGLLAIAGNLFFTLRYGASSMSIVFACVSIFILIPWVHYHYRKNMES